MFFTLYTETLEKKQMTKIKQPFIQIILVILVVLNSSKVHSKPTYSSENLYQLLNLKSKGLNFNAFEFALSGFQKLDFKKSIIGIVDLSQPSTHKRFYIIDIEKKVLLLQTYVAHGRNSGENIANWFSNKASSYQSSLGFYKTLNTYNGKHGLSLQLLGLEKNINDNAQSRAIVIHGADYVSDDFIRRTGRLGRSQGCPAVPYSQHRSVIDWLKGGACLLVYHQNYHLYTSSHSTSLPESSTSTN